MTLARPRFGQIIVREIPDAVRAATDEAIEAARIAVHTVKEARKKPLTEENP
jgi:hypothetical protein